MVDDNKGGFAEPPHIPSPNTVAGDPASDATTMSQPMVPPRPVQRLGRYALLERLGIGGMAEVYLAEQIGAAGFQKKVVVKRILPHLAADRQFVDMFAREAKVAARVSHPNVVQIFELGEQDNEFFIAMEHIDGLTLHRLAASSWEQGWALPIDVVCKTMADAALGLHAAHVLVDENGKSLHLVHRDVSPDNLMVSKDGVTKVLDFGIAKGDVGGPKTKTGNLRGKIPFMPPEQITGEVLDGRADLYALGVSMYWMLTGERPFDRQSDWHTMHAILNDAPRPPSSINPGVPPALDALVLELLGKTRDARPASGRDVADRLEDIASNGSMGGKKTTVAFLAHLLPAAPSRGNPVSEVQPKPDPKPPVGHTVPAFGGVAMASSVSSVSSVSSQVPLAVSQPTVATPPPLGPLNAPLSSFGASSSSPLAAPSPVPQAVVLPSKPDVTLALIPDSPDVTLEAPPAVSPAVNSVSAPSPEVDASIIQPPINVVARVPLDPSAAIAPVTRPAAPNAFGNVLAPAREGGIPAPAIVLGLLLVVGAVVGGGIAISRYVKANAGTGSAVVDAGVAVAPPIVDAGPPPPVEPAPVTVATKAPSKIKWSFDDVVVGVGVGSVRVPAKATALVAEDMRWHSKVSVPVVAGVADYEAVPAGVVQLVRTSDAIVVRLGDDDVSRQRKLKLVVGRYVFKITKGGSTREIPVEVKDGQTISLDVARNN